jgi:hypothetical protein
LDSICTHTHPWRPHAKASARLPSRVAQRGKLKPNIEGKFARCAAERPFKRLKQLARVIGREPVMV